MWLDENFTLSQEHATPGCLPCSTVVHSPEREPCSAFGSSPSQAAAACPPSWANAWLKQPPCSLQCERRVLTSTCTMLPAAVGVLLPSSEGLRCAVPLLAAQGLHSYKEQKAK